MTYFGSDNKGVQTVTFGQSFPDDNYNVFMTTRGGDRSYMFAFSITNKTANSFDFIVTNLMSGSESKQRDAEWIAIRF